MKRRTGRLLPALACAAALALSACGSSGGGTSSASSPSGPAVSGKATARGGSSGFCKSLTTSLNATKSLTGSALTGRPSDVKALVDKAREQAAGIVAAAPAPIKNDVQTLVNASTSYYDALAAAGYDLRKVDFTKLKALTSSNVVQASERVDAYIQSSCGINIGATP